MRMIEAVRSRFNRKEPQLIEEPQWTTGEAIEKLMQLQGQTVNLLPVLRNNEPHHAHGVINDIPIEQQELDLLSQGKWARLVYTNYFNRQGLEGDAVLWNPNLTVWPRSKYLRYHQGMWPAEKTIAFFPMVDLVVSLEMSDKTRPEAKTRHFFYFPVDIVLDTTKTEGNLYSINVHTLKDYGTTLPQSIQHALADEAKKQHWPDEWVNNDAFVLKKKGQGLITDLLAARV